jgi:hypothetical protein
MVTWRAEVPPMLKWMTQGLAQAAQQESAAQARKASILAAQRAHKRPQPGFARQKPAAPPSPSSPSSVS